jgi:PEP-CTERM motif-containing protein
MRQAHLRRVSALAVIKTSSGLEAKQRDNGVACPEAKNHRKTLSLTLSCGLFCSCITGSAYSSPLLNVTFSGDNGQLSSYYGSLVNDLSYAAADWEKLFVSGNASTLNVNVVFDDSPTANSSSLFVTPLYNTGSMWVYQQGAVDAVLNGAHNPWGPYDAAIHIGTSYLTNELWFDPNPANIDSVPVNKTDADSVFIHEFGHIFGFQGYRDQSTGTLWWPNAESVFDTWVTLLNNAPYFTGPDAESVYGGAVPLTVGNIYHVGNPSGPGADLEVYPGDLMNGNVFYRGTTYGISALDAAIFADLGLTTNFADVALASNFADVPLAPQIPEPGTIGIFGTALVGFWLARRWRRPSSQTSKPSAAI